MTGLVPVAQGGMDDPWGWSRNGRYRPGHLMEADGEAHGNLLTKVHICPWQGPVNQTCG